MSHQAWLERPYQEMYARAEAAERAEESLIEDPEWVCRHHGRPEFSHFDHDFDVIRFSAVGLHYECSGCELRTIVAWDLPVDEVDDQLHEVGPSEPLFSSLKQPCSSCIDEWFETEEERYADWQIAQYEDRMSDAEFDGPPPGWEP